MAGPDAMIRLLARTIAAVTVAASLSGCGSSATAPRDDIGTVAASSDLQFAPGTIRVVLRGESTPTATVTWVFQNVMHSVVWDAQPVGATVLDVGTTSNASVSRGFHLAGTYTYHCSIHNSMTGTIIVE